MIYSPGAKLSWFVRVYIYQNSFPKWMFLDISIHQTNKNFAKTKRNMKDLDYCFPSSSRSMKSVASADNNSEIPEVYFWYLQTSLQTFVTQDLAKEFMDLNRITDSWMMAACPFIHLQFRGWEANSLGSGFISYSQALQYGHDVINSEFNNGEHLW